MRTDLVSKPARLVAVGALLSLLSSALPMAAAVRVFPENPTWADELTIRVEGLWPNGCLPTVIEPLVGLRIVSVYVIDTVEPEQFCTQAIEAYAVEHRIGPLPPGTWTVNEFVTRPNYGGGPAEATPTTELVSSTKVEISPPDGPGTGELRVAPPFPFDDVPVELTVSGLWPDDCLPLPPTVDRTGGEITLAMEFPKTLRPCRLIATPFAYPVALGPLDAGTYHAEAVLSELLDPRGHPTVYAQTDFAVRASGGEPTGALLDFEPAEPTEDDLVHAIVSSTWPDSCVPVLENVRRLHDPNGDRIVIAAGAGFEGACLTVLTDYVLLAELPPLEAGDYQVDVVIDDRRLAAPAPRLLVSKPLRVLPGGETLDLLDGRFEVSVEWMAPDGTIGEGRPAPARSDDSGVFWFFERDNWELMVKVLDGCAINGRFWVFAAGTTDLGLTLRVRDTVFGDERVYRNPAGEPAVAITDTDAIVCALP